VLLNLIGNASKFTKNGKITLQITNINKQDIPYVRFAVKDTGIGMTSQQQEKLFQPFIQADPSITNSYGGTGLGLAISKEFIKMMGGSIQVLSELGKGSCFYFEIPITFQMIKEINNFLF